MPRLIEDAGTIRITASMLSFLDLRFAEAAVALLASEGWYPVEIKHDTVSMTYVAVMRKSGLLKYMEAADEIL